MKKLLVDKESPVLRQTAEAVPLEDIGSKKIRDIVAKMKRALHAEKDGVAIAAPQIGASLRIFMVKRESADLVFINPEIVKTSKKKRKMEEGCLSVRWLYGEVLRHEKVTIKAYNDAGKSVTIGASGLLAQIIQHEIDHLNGILFTDKAKNVRNLPPAASFVFFGSLPAGRQGSKFSEFVLEELESAGFSPVLKVTDAKAPLPKFPKDIDFGIVASFGKILPKEYLEIPRRGFLNAHPSLLPELRGSSPIQNLILENKQPGVTIIKMDEKMDHGPILAQEKVFIEPWPDHYAKVEEKLARAGGRLLAKILPNLPTPTPQDDSLATYCKLVKKEDGLLDLNDDAEKNLRKVLAYSRWPGAYFFFKNKMGKELRIAVNDAKIEDGKFVPTRVTPAGKREMNWRDFLRGN